MAALVFGGGRYRRQCQPRSTHSRDRTGHRRGARRTGHRAGRRGVDRRRPRQRPAREALRYRAGRRRLLPTQPRRRPAPSPTRRLPRLVAGGDGIAASPAIGDGGWRLGRPPPFAVIVAATDRTVAERDVAVLG